MRNLNQRIPVHVASMKPISIDNAEPYTWPSAISPDPQHPDTCNGWHLHRSANLSVIEERMQAGTAEQRRLHRQATQFFYVLAGELTIELNGELVLISPGSGYTVPAQAPHQVFNRGSGNARFLVISQPPSHGDRVAAEPGISISKN